MAIALHSAGARWGLLALLIFIIGTLLRFSFPDSLNLSDLQNFRQSAPEKEWHEPPPPPSNSAGDKFTSPSDAAKQDHGHAAGGLEDIQNSTLGVRTPT